MADVRLSPEQIEALARPFLGMIDEVLALKEQLEQQTQAAKEETA